jgi:hypothetical protein
VEIDSDEDHDEDHDLQIQTYLVQRLADNARNLVSWNISLDATCTWRLVGPTSRNVRWDAFDTQNATILSESIRCGLWQSSLALTYLSASIERTNRFELGSCYHSNLSFVTGVPAFFFPIVSRHR